MDAIVGLLNLDYTIFIQFGLFVFLFITLPILFFRPFQRLIELRHSRTVEDKQKAQELIADAEKKFEEYKSKLAAERTRTRGEVDKILSEVKAQEAAILGEARAEAKKITQASLDSIQQQGAQLKRALEADVEGIALQISDILLKRQG